LRTGDFKCPLGASTSYAYLASGKVTEEVREWGKDDALMDMRGSGGNTAAWVYDASISVRPCCVWPWYLVWASLHTAHDRPASRLQCKQHGCANLQPAQQHGRLLQRELQCWSACNRAYRRVLHRSVVVLRSVDVLQGTVAVVRVLRCDDLVSSLWHTPCSGRGGALFGGLRLTRSLAT
jgi:hypothetical protein